VLGSSFNIVYLTDPWTGSNQNRRTVHPHQCKRMMLAEGYALNDLELPWPIAPRRQQPLPLQHPDGSAQQTEYQRHCRELLNQLHIGSFVSGADPEPARKFSPRS
jgi:hypothetical protein